VSDAINLDAAGIVVNAIEDAVFACPNPPSQTCPALQFDRTDRPRVVGQTA